MQIFRSPFGNRPRSPRFQLYGRKGDRLIAPLSICLFEVEQNTSKEVLKLDTADGVFINAPVSRSNGGNLGEIEKYNWPALGLVKPFVLISTSRNVSALPVGSTNSPPNNIMVDDEVFSEKAGFSGTSPFPLKGKIISLTTSETAYGDTNRLVEAYVVKFNNPVVNDTHGLRIVHRSTNQLIGMLIASRVITPANSFGLVYPAHLI